MKNKTKPPKGYKTLSRYHITTGINRMLKLYQQATPKEKREGMCWYESAKAFTDYLSYRYKVPAETVAQIISIISPGVSWPTNKEQAENLIKVYRQSVDKNNKPATTEKKLKAVVCSTYDGNKHKAIATLLRRPITYRPRKTKNGEYTGSYGKARTTYPNINRKTALKTYAFFENIKQGKEAVNFVTIDRHHKTAFFKDPNRIKSLTPARYQDISTATKKAAESVGLEPYKFQAIVWEQVRKKQLPKHTQTRVTV